MKRSFALALAIAVFSCVFTVCGIGERAPSVRSAEAAPASGEEGYIVWNIGSEAKTWDPNMGDEDAADNLDAQLFEGLTAYSVKGAVPGVAESWEHSDDNKKWTFHLRKNAKWSDGSPVTANDFVYSWIRMCDPAVASPASTNVTDYIVGAKEFFDGTGKREDVKISAPDDYTFQVELKMGLPYYPDLVAQYYFMPTKRSAVETGEGWEKRPGIAVSNGPFVLEDHRLGSHILLKKNEYYWGAENVRLAGIKVVFVSDGNTALQGFEAGDIHVNKTIPSNEMVRLIAENSGLRNELMAGTYFIAFNMDKAPVNDVRVRKALTLAIDRKIIVEQIARGGELPASAFLPTGLSKSDGTSYRTLDANGYPIKEYFFDPQKADVGEARKLLAEAGYPNGKGFPEIELLYNTSENHKKIMEAVQAMWKENLGINVKLRNEEWQVFLSTRGKGDYYMCRAGWIGNSFDASGMLKQFQSSSGSNDYQWRYQEEKAAPHDRTLNPEQKVFEDLYQKAMNSTGRERDDAWVAAEDELMAQIPICPIYFYTNPILIDDDATEGVELSRDGTLIFKNARYIN